MTGGALLLRDLRRLLGPDGLLEDAAARRVYARDASHLTGGRPLAVALPRSGDEAEQVLRRCAAAGVPVVCRGSGTGLSGGAVPADGQLVLSLARLTGLGPVDVRGRRVRVEAGVLNEQISRHAAGCGLHFAPDPSSQAAATLGGNIAENAGGPHCLRHGVTLQHLLRLDWLDARGRARTTGRGLTLERGPDLTTLLCGSEGTLGVVTGALVGLTPVPEREATLLAFFPRLDAATAAVAALLGDGLLPVAVEIVDQAMLWAVEAAFGFGFPTDVGAALIAEFAGAAAQVAGDAERAAALLRAGGAREVRLARDAHERAALWRCRKKAFGAIGRLTPNYVTMDVVVPLGQLPGLVRDIQALQAEHGVEVATAFHAGDGNLHPGVQYDDRDPASARRAHAAADAIIRRALARGGSITGEHGVGLEKLHALPWQLDAETARLCRGVQAAFDPDGLLNPGKALPPAAAAYAAAPPLPASVRFAWEDLTVSAPADTPVAELQAAALARGFWIPLGRFLPRPALGPGLGTVGSVGDLLRHRAADPCLVGGWTARDLVLELWAETGDGRAFHTGAPVFKNVAGYGLTPFLVGSGDLLVTPLAATFKLRPAPPRLAWWRLEPAAEPAVAERGLEPLWALLDGRPPDQGAPVAVGEVRAARPVGPLWVFAAGSDAAWDLGRLDDDLASAAAACGLRVAGRGAGPLADGPADPLPGDLPEWTRGAGTWTRLGREPDHPAAGPDPDLPPAASCRFIRQSFPAAVWTPGVLTAAAPWHADPVWASGTVAPLPEPAAGVPRAVLGRLKHLFDPQGRLPGPAWLTTGGQNDDSA